MSDGDTKEKLNKNIVLKAAQNVEKKGIKISCLALQDEIFEAEGINPSIAILSKYLKQIKNPAHSRYFAEFDTDSRFISLEKKLEKLTLSIAKLEQKLNEVLK